MRTASRTSTGGRANAGNGATPSPDASGGPADPPEEEGFVYLSVNALRSMTAQEISDFAAKELSLYLDPNRPKSWLLGRLYRVGVVEELLG